MDGIENRGWKRPEGQVQVIQRSIQDTRSMVWTRLQRLPACVCLGKSVCVCVHVCACVHVCIARSSFDSAFQFKRCLLVPLCRSHGAGHRGKDEIYSLPEVFPGKRRVQRYEEVMMTE